MAQKKIKIGMKAILIKDTGEVMEIEPENGLNFKLQELYKILNCKLIELVVTKDGKLIVLDEEGKLQSKSVNTKATELYKYGEQDVIVGDVIVCNNKQIK